MEELGEHVTGQESQARDCFTIGVTGVEGGVLTDGDGSDQAVGWRDRHTLPSQSGENSGRLDEIFGLFAFHLPKLHVIGQLPKRHLVAALIRG